jgi:hypothetical protein
MNKSNARNNAIDCNLQNNYDHDRARFQFEADSDDNKMEDRIEDKLGRYFVLIIRVWVLICVFPDKIASISRTLNEIAGEINREVTAQCKIINRIEAKSDMVNAEIADNQAKLDRIK